MTTLNTQNLPYQSSPKSALAHYARYITLPATEKTHWLITLARHDPFYAQIITDLEAYGYQIHHPFYGQNGAYLPETIELIEECNIAQAVQTLHKQGEIKASFSLSSRYGGAQIAHYWLHELTHFWQDLHGLFLTPLHQKNTIPVMLDAPSHITVTCFCEAMAETEALRASWRLKEQGHTIAWQGARASLDWGKHARAYEKDMQTMPEPKAAKRAFDRWHQSNQRPYYEKRALKTYKKTLSELPLKTPDQLTPQLRHINLEDLIKLLPKPQRPNYLTPPLNTPLYTTIHHKNTAKKVQALEQQYSPCQNPNIQDIKTSSTLYIWKQKTNKITIYDD